MSYLNLGIECWTEGDHWYTVTLGDGSPVTLTGIAGNISLFGGGESLVSFTTDDIINGPVNGKIEPGPDQGPGNYSASQNFGTIIVKGEANMPFVLSMPDIHLRDGRFKILIESQTMDGGEPDVELQFNAAWK